MILKYICVLLANAVKENHSWFKFSVDEGILTPLVDVIKNNNDEDAKVFIYLDGYFSPLFFIFLFCFTFFFIFIKGICTYSFKVDLFRKKCKRYK